MTAFVVDASVVVKWVSMEADSDQALFLMRNRRLLAPDLLVAEIANTLATKIRLRELSLSEAQEAAGFIRAVRIEFAATADFMATAIDLAATLRHPAYDCFYLALALAKGVRFVTADSRFLHALERFGDEQQRAACLSLADAVTR